MHRIHLPRVGRGRLGALTPLFLASSIGALACGDRSDPVVGPGPDVDLEFGVTVFSSLDFADAPLEGRLRLVADDPTPGVRFSVDLDGDGRPDDDGDLGLGVSLPYRLERPGVHTLAVTLEKEGARRRLERRVVVNDGEAVSAVEVTVAVPRVDRPGRFPGGVEGLLFSTDGRWLFTTDEREGLLRAFRWPEGIEVWRFDLYRVEQPEFSGGPSTSGLAFSDDEAMLYVDLGDTLGVVRGPKTATPVLEATSVSLEEYSRWRELPDGDLLLGGWVGLARLDPVSGEILARFRPDSGAWDFAVSRDGTRVALNSYYPFSVALLDARTLSVERRIPLSAEPLSVAFSPGGDRVYVLADGGPPGSTGYRGLRLVTVEVATGRIRSDRVIAPGEGTSPHEIGLASPTAYTADGRYVIFATPRGAFFVDPVLDLPRFRTSRAGGALLGCCNVTIHPVTGAVVFADPSAEAVLAVRVR